MSATTWTLSAAPSACGGIRWRSSPPAEYEQALRVEFFGDEIDRISEIEVVSGQCWRTLEHAAVFPATHYATDHRPYGGKHRRH